MEKKYIINFHILIQKLLKLYSIFYMKNEYSEIISWWKFSLQMSICPVGYFKSEALRTWDLLFFFILAHANLSHFLYSYKYV